MGRRQGRSRELASARSFLDHPRRERCQVKIPPSGRVAASKIKNRRLLFPAPMRGSDVSESSPPCAQHVNRSRCRKERHSARAPHCQWHSGRGSSALPIKEGPGPLCQLPGPGLGTGSPDSHRIGLCAKCDCSCQWARSRFRIMGTSGCQCPSGLRLACQCPPGHQPRQGAPPHCRLSAVPCPPVGPAASGPEADSGPRTHARS
jgi:hypothetical protein